MKSMAELPAVDIDVARAKLGSLSDRVAGFLESAADPMAPVPGLVWTAGELAAHLASGMETYASFARGSTEAVYDITDIPGGSLTRSSRVVLDAESERHLAVLASRMRHGVDDLLEASEGRATDEIVMWNGQPVGLGTLVGLAAAELLVHGSDLAKALGKSWPIAPEEARLVLSSALPLLPLLLNPETAGNVTASYELRVRGGGSLTLEFANGTLTVGPAGKPVDCHVSAEPVALLLVSYGRMSQWRPALTGKMVAWGRRPWLGLRLTHYLVRPG
jgi:uncharacterized protein (TIGR03083 family)